MPTIPRYYEPAPAPPPPDEDYWSALLEQADKELGDDHHDEIDWAELNDLNLPLAQDGSHLHGLPEDWEAAEHAFHDDTSVRLNVVGFNRGGVLVEWKSLRGFVPASQLIDLIEQDHANHTQEEILASYIGTMLPLRVIELDREHNRLILSERAAQVSPGTRAELLLSIQPNSIVEGYVTNICEFGVFVDLGGVEGLIHISELSWGRVEHPSEVVQRSQRLRVFVMDIDRQEGRIALSLKRMLPDPWLTVEEHYSVGQIVEGTITSVVDFGAFACLEEGLEGLIHISELAEGHFLHPRNVVQEGQCVKVRVLNIDSRARRIGLSLRNVKVQQARSD